MMRKSSNLVMIYQDGILKFVNKVACERLGWEFEEITSPSFDIIEKMFPQKLKEQAIENIAKRLHGEQIPPHELTLRTRAGSEIIVIVNGHRFFYHGRPAIEYELIDITEQKKLELARANRTCSKCESSNLMRDFDAGEIVCISCGQVMDDKIMDISPEWRAFDNEQKIKKTRVGMPLSYAIHDKGLSTEMDWNHIRSIRGTVNPYQIEELHSLKKWENRTWFSNAKERNLSEAFSELKRLSFELKLPKSTAETASVIFRKALKKQIARGRASLNILAAAVYLSCRQCGIPRTLNEIATIANMSRKALSKNYRVLVKVLNAHVPLSNSQEYVAKISNNLKLSGMTEILAIKILEVAEDIRLTNGKGPNGMASAATYIASVLNNERKSQGDIAKVANVTTVTLRNRFKELSKRLLIEVDL